MPSEPQLAQVLLATRNRFISRMAVVKQNTKAKERHADRLDIPGLVFLRISRLGKLIDANEVAARALGYDFSDFLGLEVASVVGREFLEILNPFFRSTPQPVNDCHRVTLRHVDGKTAVSVVGVIRTVQLDTRNQVVDIVGPIDAAGAQRLADLESNATLLTGFIELSSEAMWCMEYAEPVNLASSDQEIVRQVFENECHWRMCNRAMARLYNLPDGLDFNRQPISAVFRRNPENEAFVRQLIATRFHIDAAPSLDVRHDGSLAFIENTVRSDIEGVSLLRLWGTVRDVTQLRTTESKLTERQREVTEILHALPDPVLVVDMGRRAVALNTAFETTFGWSATQVLGQDVSPIIDLETRRPNQRRWFADTERRWIAAVRVADQCTIRCDVRIARMGDDADRRFVLAMRPVPDRPPRSRKASRTKAANRRSTRK